MSDELVLYTNPMSRGRIARWMLEEVGQPYRTEILNYDGVKKPEYLALNPMGKVPALRHGEMVVTEGAAICAYLADAFPQANLAPPSGDRRRGPYYRWLMFTAGPIEAALTDKALGVVVPSERKKMVGYGSIEDVLGTLETALAGKTYIDGDTFTAADLYLSSQLAFGMMFNTIEKRPVFQAYVSGLATRAAAVRAREIDDALLASAAAGT